MTIETQYFNYFKSVNPLAQKIGEDIEGIIKNQHEKWNSLEAKEKDKLLDQSLIDETLVKKYESKGDEDYDDDYGELSTFSWFTKSQLNLFTLINVKPERSRTLMKKSDVLSPLKKMKAPPPAKQAKPTRTSKEEKVCPKKPKTPPPPPPSKLVPAECKGLLQENLGDDIPKTGFDFLDNW